MTNTLGPRRDGSGISTSRGGSSKKFGRCGWISVAVLLAAGWAALPSQASADSDNGNAFVVCHTPPGDENSQTLHVAESAVPAHLGHGDTLGECPEPSPPFASADFAHAIIGQPFTYDVLANDSLGHPTATITALIGFDANNGCEDFSFDLATGVVTGTPSFGSGSCGVFRYTLSNGSGESTTLVLITVTFN